VAAVTAAADAPAAAAAGGMKTSSTVRHVAAGAAAPFHLARAAQQLLAVELCTVRMLRVSLVTSVGNSTWRGLRAAACGNCHVQLQGHGLTLQGMVCCLWLRAALHILQCSQQVHSGSQVDGPSSMCRLSGCSWLFPYRVVVFLFGCLLCCFELHTEGLS
jgi:hypothetical protein